MSGIKRTFGDTMVMTGRCMRHSFRSIDTLITAIVQPVMIMLLFVYVLGGAMDVGSENYINFVVPGIVLICIVSLCLYHSVFAFYQLCLCTGGKHAWNRSSICPKSADDPHNRSSAYLTLQA